MTALTLIETLSRVITSWGGTSMATVRRLTLTHLVDERHQQDEARAVALAARVEDGLGAAAEAEDDRPLVLRDDPDERAEEEQRDHQDDER